MPFSSEAVESRCRIGRTDLRRGRGGEGGAGAEKRTTRRRRYAVRSHIGSDTSNPEATPQIPPSCWTSCSLHNRIRMNRPSPALSSLSTLSLSCLLVYTLLALFELVFPLFPSLPSFVSFLSSFFDTLLSLSPRLPYPFFTRRFSFYPLRPSPSSRCSSRATDAPRFFLSVFAETLRRRPRTKPPRFLRDRAFSPAFPPRVTVSPPFIESCRR